MSERYFAYGTDVIEQEQGTCACPAVAALDLDETHGVIADIAGMYDRRVSDDDMGLDTGTVSESGAKAAWLDMIDDLRPNSVRHGQAVEVAEELGWV